MFWKMNEMDEASSLKKDFPHLFDELQLKNVVHSLRENTEAIQKAHDAVHEFLFLAPISIPEDKEWFEKSAFLTYQYSTFEMLHQSFFEALGGHYNSSHILLRSSLELLLKGAFWECLAHEELRKKAKIIKKQEKKFGPYKKSLIDFIEDVIQKKPEIKGKLENNSIAIFDVLSEVLETPWLNKLVPSNFKMVEQLIQWNVFDLLPDPKQSVYREVYRELCKDVHVLPDKTDVGRRLNSDAELFEVKTIPKELFEYLKIIQKIADIGILIELNILKDWINQNKTSPKLVERVKVLQSLNLPVSHRRLNFLVS